MATAQSIGPSTPPQTQFLTSEQWQHLARIKRVRREGFIPTLLDVDLLLEIIADLLRGAL